MPLKFVILLLCIFNFFESSESKASSAQTYTSPIWAHCALTDKQSRFEVLPGGGWDNLVNEERGRVLNFNYTQCSYSEDGVYLLPDNVFLIPSKTSKVHFKAELFSHFSNYSSMTSNGVNVNAGVNYGGFGFSGKFSSEFTNVHEKQVRDSSQTVRIQLRYSFYEARSSPDSDIHPVFRNRLLDVVAHLIDGNDRAARYLCDLIVRDFGTHVVNSMDAGAILAKLDQVKSSYVGTSDEHKTSIKASASFSFGKIFNLGVGYSYTHDEKKTEGYASSLTDSTAFTVGGPPFRVNFSVNSWVDSLSQNLVAIDRNGVPLHYVVTLRSLPEVPEPMVFQLADHVEKAVQRYYVANIIKGCTNPSSPNFDFQANVDNNLCHVKSNNFSFGGLYQTCSGDQTICSQYVQKNPATGDLSCSKDYESVQIQNSVVECRRSCHSKWILWVRCENLCGTITSFWCSAKSNTVAPENGFLFGGLYTDHFPNPVVNSKSCPPSYYKMRLGARVQVCISDDYELGSKYRLPFGGFFSCKSGNPLAVPGRVVTAKVKSEKPRLLMQGYLKSEGGNAWPNRCPEGFSQHLATIENDCSIHYCVKTNAMSAYGSLIPIKRPPFESQPYTQKNYTEVKKIIGPSNRVWLRNTKGDWELQSEKYSNPNTHPAVIATLSVIGTLLIGIFIIAGIVHRGRLRRLANRYQELQPTAGMSQSDANDYGSMNDGGPTASSAPGEEVESDDEEESRLSSVVTSANV